MKLKIIVTFLSIAVISGCTNAPINNDAQNTKKNRLESIQKQKILLEKQVSARAEKERIESRKKIVVEKIGQEGDDTENFNKEKIESKEDTVSAMLGLNPIENSGKTIIPSYWEAINVNNDKILSDFKIEGNEIVIHLYNGFDILKAVSQFDKKNVNINMMTTQTKKAIISSYRIKLPETENRIILQTINRSNKKGYIVIQPVSE
jgi:sRNA-binding regulator protein Hfq